MSDLSKIVELIIQVKDNASAGLKATSVSLKTLDTTVQKSKTTTRDMGVAVKGTSGAVKAFDKVVGDLEKGLSDSVKQLKRAEKGIDAVGDKSKKSAKKVDGLGSAISGAASAVTQLVAAVGALVIPVAESAKFERAMAEVKAIVGDVSDVVLQQMIDKAREMGATTEYSAKQAAQGLKYLAMAGFDATNAMAALPGVLNLAQAGSMDLGRSADIVTNVLTGMNLAVSDLGRVNDVLVATFTKTNSTLEELGYAMAYVAPVAQGMGVTLEGTATALGLLHNAGMKGCYDDQTEVLTKEGWKFWGDVLEADQFATYNEQTGGIEFQEAERLIRYCYTGKMYKVQNKNLDFCVTPDHRLYVKQRNHDCFEILRASEVQGKSVRYMTGGLAWEGGNPKWVTLPGFIQNRGNYTKVVPQMRVPSTVWASFLGWYLSEGSCDVSAGSYRVRITQKKPRYLKEIAQLLDKMPWGYNYNSGSFVIFSEQLYKAVVDFGDVYKKYIPQYAKNWGIVLSEDLYGALLKGDGDSNKTYYTSSVQLKDDVQELALKLGYSTYSTVKTVAGCLSVMQDGRKVQATIDNWRVSVSSKCSNPGYIQSAYTGKHGIRSNGRRHTVFEGYVDYDGEVFCAEVPNHLLVVRRNGHVIVSGNSMAGTTLRGVLTRLVSPTRQAQEVLDTLAQRLGKTSFEVVDASGKFVGFEKVLKQFEDAGLTSAEAMRMLGQRAGPGLVALLTQGSNAFGKLNKRLEDSKGIAARVAKEMHDNLIGDLRALLSIAIEVAIVIGDQLKPVVRALTQTIIAAIEVVNAFVECFPNLTKGVVLVTAAFIALVGAIASVKITAGLLSVIGINWSGIIVGINAVVASLGTLGTAVTVTGALFAAAFAVIAAVVSAFVGAYAFGSWIRSLVDGTAEAKNALKILGAQAKETQKELQEFADFKIEERADIVWFDEDQLAEYHKAFKGALEYQAALMMDLRVKASETSFWTGEQTAEAKQAEKDLEVVGARYKDLRSAIDEYHTALEGPTGVDIGKRLATDAIAATEAYSTSIGEVAEEYKTLEKEASRAWADINKTVGGLLDDQIQAIIKWAGIYDSEFDGMAYTAMSVFGGLTDSLKTAVESGASKQSIASLGVSLKQAAKVGAGAFQTMGDDVRGVLDAIVAKEQELVGVIEKISERIVGIHETTADKRAAIDQETMSASEKYYDNRARSEAEFSKAAALRAQAEEITGEGRNKLLEKANEHNKKALSLSERLISAEKDGVSAVQSRADRRAALNRYEKESIDNLKLMKSAVESELKVWQETKMSVQVVKDLIDEMAVTLNKTLTLDLNSEVALTDLEKIQGVLSELSGAGTLFNIQITGSGSETLPIGEKLEQLKQQFIEIGEKAVPELNIDVFPAVQGIKEVDSSLDVLLETITEVEDKVIGLLRQIAELRTTTVVISVVVRGLDIVRQLKVAIDGLQNKTVRIVTQHVEGHAGGGSVGLFRRLASPLITMGSGLVDDVPAMLKRDEYVMKPSAVKKYGVGFMTMVNEELLNVGNMVTAFMNGGLVSSAGVGAAMGHLQLIAPQMLSGGGLAGTEGSTGEMTVNLNLPGAGQQIPTRMKVVDAEELINQLKNLDRFKS